MRYPDVRYEKSDAKVGMIFAFGVGLLMVGLVVHATAAWLFDTFKEGVRRDDAQPITLAVVVMLLGLGEAASQSLKAMPDIGIDQRLNEMIPLDLTFRNESGDAVTLDQYFGTRPVVLVLAYYRCPRLCNVALNSLAS